MKVVVGAGHPLHPAVPGVIFDLAADRTEGADAPGDRERPGAGAELEGLADQGAGRAGGDAVAAEFTVERTSVHRVDDGSLAAIDDGYGVGADDFVVDLDALFAEDAAVRVAFQQPPVIADRPPLQERRIFLPDHILLIAGVLQGAFAAGVADRAVEGMVDQEEFHHLAADEVSCSDRVVTLIPSLTGVLQAVMGRPTPSISTAQMRQAPVGETFLSQQRVGILIPSRAAASRMVVSSSTAMFLPSIVRVTMNTLRVSSN